MPFKWTQLQCLLECSKRQKNLLPSWKILHVIIEARHQEGVHMQAAAAIFRHFSFVCAHLKDAASDRTFSYRSVCATTNNTLCVRNLQLEAHIHTHVRGSWELFAFRTPAQLWELPHYACLILFKTEEKKIEPWLVQVIVFGFLLNKFIHAKVFSCKVTSK